VTEEPSQPATDGNWTQFGYDAANTGYIPAAVGPESVGVTQSGIGSLSDDTLAIYHGQLFSAGTRYPIPVQEGEGTEIATNVIHSAFSEGVLYVTGSSDNIGQFQALETDGTLIWETTLSPDRDRSFPMGAPALASGRLYQATGDGIVHAVDTATGELQWEYDMGSQKQTTPAIADETVYIAGNETVALSTEGTERWTHDREFSSSPTLGDGAIYLLGNPSYRDVPGVYAIDTADGSEQWSTELSGGAGIEGLRNIAYDGSTVYVNTGSTLAALAPSTGGINWEVELGGAGEMVITTTTVYATGRSSSAGFIGAYQKETGDEIWTEIIDYPILTEPVVSGDNLYVGAGNGLYVFSGSQN